MLNSMSMKKFHNFRIRYYYCFATSHPRGLKSLFLSDFRPREEYYVLLNDESLTIQRFGKMLKSSIRI